MEVNSKQPNMYKSQFDLPATKCSRMKTQFWSRYINHLECSNFPARSKYLQVHALKGTSCDMATCYKSHLKPDTANDAKYSDSEIHQKTYCTTVQFWCILCFWMIKLGEVVKKRIFYGQADRKGGGSSPFSKKCPIFKKNALFSLGLT